MFGVCLVGRLGEGSPKPPRVATRRFAEIKIVATPEGRYGGGVFTPPPSKNAKMHCESFLIVMAISLDLPELLKLPGVLELLKLYIYIVCLWFGMLSGWLHKYIKWEAVGFRRGLGLHNISVSGLALATFGSRARPVPPPNPAPCFSCTPGERGGDH